MSTDGQRTKFRRNVAENYNRLSRVHERYRQTDGRQHIIITDEYDLGGTVALRLQDHLTLLIVSHVTTNQSTTA